MSCLIHCRRSSRLLWLAAWFLPVALHAAGPNVEIVVGPNIDPTEKLAAEELSRQLKTLFDANTTQTTSLIGAEHAIVLGTVRTNPTIAKLFGGSWPKLSPEGILIRTVKNGDRPVLVVGGETPRATLWAVYELGHRWGLRSLLQGDFVPVQRPEFALTEWDVAQEPVVHTRAWQLMNGGALGWEGWSEKDLRRLLQQLAKQKYNRVVLSWRPEHPYFDFETGSVRKSSGVLFSGEEYDVRGDIAGRTAFRGATRFENADFANAKDYSSRLAAGKKVIESLISAANEFGMDVAVELSPLELPPEFAKSNREVGGGNLELAVAQVRACLTTYPNLDAIYLKLPNLDKTPVELVSVLERTIGELDSKRTKPLERYLVTPAALSLPKNTSFKLVRPNSSEGDSAEPSPRTTVLDLFDESVGALPQMVLKRLDPVGAAVAGRKLDGWIVSCRVPSDVELASYYLSRLAFDPEAKIMATSDELIGTIAGEGVAERLLRGFEQVEQANQIVAKNAVEFAEPKAGLLDRVSGQEPPPGWWKEVRTLYTDAMNEMYRGNTRAREGGRDFIRYYARRYEFGLTYMSGMEALRLSSIAKGESKPEDEVMQLEAAVEAIYNSLGAFAEVARDASDRGTIAVLNRHVYRPLLEKLEQADAGN